MTKLEELKATRDAARNAAAEATWDAADTRDAAKAADAAYEEADAAYEAELKKHKENGAMSKLEELKQTRDAEAAADAWAKENTGVRRSNAKTNRRRTMNMLGLTGEEQ
jgi:hypothetical protein